MAAQHTARRTKDYLEKKEGYSVGKTEQALFRFTAHKDAATGKTDRRAEFLKRRDLFGFIDMIAMNDSEIIGVQACSSSDINPHIDLILKSEMALRWARAGGVIRIYAWRKVLPSRTSKRALWKPRIIVFYIDRHSSPTSLRYNEFDTAKSGEVEADDAH